MKKTVISLLFLAMSLCLYARGLRVVFIGDSITDGNWGVVYNYKPTSAQRSQTDMNHIYGHGYVNAVASYYEAKYPSREFLFFNRGFSGHSLSDLESRWQEDVLDLHPDILSVLIGTNDIHAALPDTGSFDFEGWKARYKALLERVRERNPSVKLVLCTPFVAKVGKVGDSADYARREEAVAHLASIIRELAEECDAIVVPFDTLFFRLGKKAPGISHWIWDGIHPTPAGHFKMAELWRKKVHLR
ncbi:MAG: SGNH/GDSL hydrolase family protein [Bacteroidales bacterium]|nr:SGNH/GDSL hydrolase family protein [Bacteroidales bacterium]